MWEKHHKTFYQLTVIILATFTFSSCAKSSTIENVLLGQYSTVEVEYNGSSLVHNIHLHIIEFYKNGSLKLPAVYKLNDEIVTNLTQEGRWFVSRNNNVYKLSIESDNNYFAGDFIMQFKKSPINGDLILILKNEHLYLKGVRDYLLYRNINTQVEKSIEYTANADSLISENLIRNNFAK